MGGGWAPHPQSQPRWLSRSDFVEVTCEHDDYLHVGGHLISSGRVICELLIANSFVFFVPCFERTAQEQVGSPRVLGFLMAASEPAPATEPPSPDPTPAPPPWRWCSWDGHQATLNPEPFHPRPCTHARRPRWWRCGTRWPPSWCRACVPRSRRSCSRTPRAARQPPGPRHGPPRAAPAPSQRCRCSRCCCTC